MLKRMDLWGLLLLSLLILESCGQTAGPNPVTQPTAVPEPTASSSGAPEGVLMARETVLAYLAEHYADQAPSAGLSWVEERTTPEGLVGSESYRYTAGDWSITIAYPVVAPDMVIYQVTVDNEATGFEWQGMVDAQGQLTESPPLEGEVAAMGWFGRVLPLADGAQFDDYLKLEPEGTGDVGIEGADDTVRAEIEALKKTESYGYFWGTLTCGVPDYGGCQLLVTRVHSGRAAADPDPVEGWEGVIVPFEPGSQYDDYFVLAGEFPVRYGIGSIDPAVTDQLKAASELGSTVRVWGELSCGVMNAYGSHIEVTRLETVGTPGNTVDGWAGRLIKLAAGSQFGGYFEREDGERFDIGASDELVQQQIETYRWTGAQVQVWGQVFYGVPATEARHIEIERIEALSGPAEQARNLTPFAAAEASSILPSDQGGTYHAYSAVDGALETTWSEGVEGAGQGEWLLLTFPGAIVVDELRFSVGFDHSEEFFFANNRIKRATMILDNEQIELDFADERGLQMFPLAQTPDAPIETTMVKVVIQEVYPGSVYNDTCLAEIEVWGRVK